MKLTCPACGAVASAEAWANDIAARTALAAAIQLPDPVCNKLLPYLALFRPAERALSWRKALALIQELGVLVGRGYVHAHGSPDRPCTPEVWALAMGQMTENANAISRPLPNHNYLRKVAWQISDRLDAHQESTRHQDERSGAARAQRQIEQREDVVLTDAEKEILARLGLDKTIEQMRRNK